MDSNKTLSKPISKPLIIAQIGIGHNHASEIMRTVRKMPTLFQVVGVAESDPSWRERRGQDSAYAGLAWLTEEEILSRDDIAAVLVETDVPQLSSTALRCLQAGKHLFMDKPGGETVAEFAQVIEEARRQNLVAHLGYMFRGNPAINFCIDAVRQAWLGNIFEIDAVMNRMADLDYRAWMSQFTGGAMYIFGGHLIDIVLSMLGQPDRIVPLLKQTRPEHDKLTDNGLAILEYTTATAVIRTAVVEVDGFLRRQLVVCGDRGTIEIHPIEPFNQLEATTPRLRMTLAEACGHYEAGRHDVVFPAMPDRYCDLLEQFARAVSCRKEKACNYDHELLLHSCTLQACGLSLDDNNN